MTVYQASVVVNVPSTLTNVSSLGLASEEIVLTHSVDMIALVLKDILEKIAMLTSTNVKMTDV